MVQQRLPTVVPTGDLTNVDNLQKLCACTVTNCKPPHTFQADIELLHQIQCGNDLFALTAVDTYLCEGTFGSETNIFIFLVVGASGTLDQAPTGTSHPKSLSHPMYQTTTVHAPQFGDSCAFSQSFEAENSPKLPPESCANDNVQRYTNPL